MEEVVYYNNLYDLYGDLLTEKQKQYFEDYYFNNLSFSEMAENYNVSRNAVFKQLHIVIDKLEEYEKKLQLFKKKEKLLKVIDKVTDKKLKEELEGLL
jgi:predicted DNA-binding protein YlxM (UPF0122 family)